MTSRHPPSQTDDARSGVEESRIMPPGDVEGALADADVSIDALLGKEASAGDPAYRLAGNVSVEFDVALVEEQVRARSLCGSYAREPLAVSLVLREEAVLSEGSVALLCESKRKLLVANGRLSITQVDCRSRTVPAGDPHDPG
ncbi:hypothetical protein ADJ70_02350 [Olsenella sp. oral taxon 807]|nr:hypothetical protein ADJ70_02350 [Olsenella sp. oral taxon 807]